MGDRHTGTRPEGNSADPRAVARERDVVLKVIYGMTEAQFRQYWISKIFRLETSSGPKIVYSTEMAAELVTAIPGAWHSWIRRLCRRVLRQ